MISLTIMLMLQTQVGPCMATHTFEFLHSPTEEFVTENVFNHWAIPNFEVSLAVTTTTNCSA